MYSYYKYYAVEIYCNLLQPVIERSSMIMFGLVPHPCMLRLTPVYFHPILHRDRTTRWKTSLQNQCAKLQGSSTSQGTVLSSTERHNISNKFKFGGTFFFKAWCSRCSWIETSGCGSLGFMRRSARIRNQKSSSNYNVSTKLWKKYLQIWTCYYYCVFHSTYLIVIDWECYLIYILRFDPDTFIDFASWSRRDATRWQTSLQNQFAKLQGSSRKAINF